MFISACRMVMLYICAKFHEIILNGIKVIEWTRFLYRKFQRGIIPQNLCTSFGHVLYFYQVLWNYLKRYPSYRADTISILYQVSWNYLKRCQSYRADTISILKITKGNNSAKNVGGMTVVNLCMSSGHALYFYQVL